MPSEGYDDQRDEAPLVTGTRPAQLKRPAGACCGRRTLFIYLAPGVLRACVDPGRPAFAAPWNDGVHTSTVSRRRVTGSKLDVQYSKLAALYPFGFEAFDNAHVRHAVHHDPLFLRFARWKPRP